MNRLGPKQPTSHSTQPTMHSQHTQHTGPPDLPRCSRARTDRSARCGDQGARSVGPRGAGAEPWLIRLSAASGPRERCERHGPGRRISQGLQSAAEQAPGTHKSRRPNNIQNTHKTYLIDPAGTGVRTPFGDWNPSLHRQRIWLAEQAVETTPREERVNVTVASHEARIAARPRVRRRNFNADSPTVSRSHARGCCRVSRTGRVARDGCSNAAQVDDSDSACRMGLLDSRGLLFL